MTTISFHRWSGVAEAKAHYKRRVDERAGEARRRFAADWLLDEEYTLTASEARAFVDNGHSGKPPDTVQAWADAAGLSAQAAADDILATRDAYNAALRTARRERLMGKADIDAAATVREVVEAARAAEQALDALTPP